MHAKSVKVKRLVSSNIIGDLPDGDQVKVMSWYHNEWGYANRLLRVASR